MSARGRGLARRLARVRAVVCDVDGVLTDGRVIYDRTGERMKAFNTKDGMAVKMLRERGIAVALMTAKKTGIAEARARSLGMDVAGVGAVDKLKTLMRYLKSRRVTLERTAYAGDDLNDLETLRRVGLAIAPRDACLDVRRVAHWVTRAGGGEGVLREIAERLIRGKR